METKPWGYQAAELVIDLKRERVLRNEQVLPLPKLSFDLLVALVTAAPELVSADTLMDIVWSNVVVSPETVTQRVKLLRSSLGDNSHDPRYIAGVRGRGYKWLTSVQSLAEAPGEAARELATSQAVTSAPASLPFSTAASTPAETPVLHSSKRGRLALRWAAGLVCTVFATAILWFSLQVPAQAPALAVLPLTNLSPDPDQQYLADGLTEDLIHKLSRVQGLDVTGSISSFYFKGRNSSLDEITELLDVDYLLQGGLRRADNRVRITLQLLEADGGAVRWSQTYDAQMHEYLTVQDQIATTVTQELGLVIGVGDFNRPGMTKVADAYNHYLLAKSAIIASREDLQRAQGHIDAALTIDPAFALAAALRARVMFTGIRLMTPTEQAQVPARFAQVKADVRELIAQLPELQLIEFGEYDLQQRYAEGETTLLAYLAGAGTSAASAEGHRAYGTFLRKVGRHGAAIQALLRARHLEPLDMQVVLAISSVLIDAGRYAEASAEIERGLALGGADAVLRNLQLKVALFTNDKRGFVTSLEQSDQIAASQYALAQLWLAGETQAALAELRALASDQDYDRASLWVAEWAAVLGDSRLALQILAAIGAADTLWAPVFSDIRLLPGFRELVRELGLVEYWRSTGSWADHCQPSGDDFTCN